MFGAYPSPISRLFPIAMLVPYNFNCFPESSTNVFFLNSAITSSFRQTKNQNRPYGGLPCLSPPPVLSLESCTPAALSPFQTGCITGDAAASTRKYYILRNGTLA